MMALLQDLEIFLKGADIAPSRLGRVAVSDPRFVFDLRGGRVPGLRTESRIRHFLQSNNPSTTLGLGLDPKPTNFIVQTGESQ
jgi:hypothetical protein